MVELYTSLILGDNMQHKIICARHLHELLRVVKGK